MKLKKFIKSTCTLAVMLLIVGMYISPSVAKASYDNPYGFAFDYDEDVDFTEKQVKNTYSSVGMECTNSESEYAYYVARVFGVDDNEESFDYSHGYEYTFYEGTSYEMLNWVRENGCNHACVKGIGYSVDGEYGTVFSGYWNPDIY